MPGWVMLLAGVVGLAGIYGVLTLGLNLQFGAGGMINFGVVGFFAAGSYAYTILTQPAPPAGSEYLFGFGLPWWVGFLGAGAIGALFGLIVGIPTLRVQGEYLFIVTFAFSEVMLSSIRNETWLTNGSKGFYNVVMPLRGLATGHTYQLILTGLILLVLGLSYVVVHTLVGAPFGRVLRSIRESEQVALSVGKAVFSVRLRAFVVGTALAGLAGAMYVWYMTVTMPSTFTASATFAAWIALAIGGTGNSRGAVAGAFVLIGAQQAVRFIHFSADTAPLIAAFQYMIEGLLLVIIMRFWPRGILPEKSPGPPREEDARSEGAPVVGGL